MSNLAIIRNSAFGVYDIVASVIRISARRIGPIFLVQVVVDLRRTSNRS